MKSLALLLFMSLSFICFSQTKDETYLAKYEIKKESISELTFKNKAAFNNFIQAFEDKKGFELPKFLIIDHSGKLLKHNLDVLISECGKGDVNNLKKRYQKNLPDLEKLNEYFNEQLVKPKENDFIVVFIWHEAMDKYNKHTFETYKTWKENENITFYFLNLEYK